MTEPQPDSSDTCCGGLNESALAVLLACHHRGPLTAAELERLLSAAVCAGDSLPELLRLGLLQRHGARHAVTAEGRAYLDRVLEGIESQLSPDDPAPRGLPGRPGAEAARL